MNDPESTPLPAEYCVKSLFEKTEDFVRREPGQATAIAFGAGLLFHLLPANAIARPLASTVVRLLPPALLGLGVLKAYELFNQSSTFKSKLEELPEKLLD